MPLDEKGRLVVQEVLPPSPREESRQNDRDHLLVASRLDLVEPARPRYLLTEPGVGYRLATE